MGQRGTVMQDCEIFKPTWLMTVSYCPLWEVCAQTAAGVASAR